MEDLNPLDILICDVPEIRELLSMFYRLSVSDIDVFFNICGSNGLCAFEIATRMGKDKSTVQRCINKLYSVGVIKRESKCCTDGKKGRYFVYSVISKPELNDMLIMALKTWYNKRHDLLSSM